MAEPITLAEYEASELEMAAGEARRGLTVHIAVTVAVCVALILVNVFAVPQFPWSPFPVAGMSIGVLMHFLGVRHLVPTMRAHQEAVERRAAQLKGA